MTQFAKAIYATIIGFLGPLAVVLVGDTGFDDITAGQWISAVIAALVAGGGVYGISNSPPPAK